MQSKPSANTESSSSKSRYQLAAVIVLFITSATLAFLLIMQRNDYTNYKTDTTAQITGINQQLLETNELSQQRQDEIDLLNEQQEIMRAEFLVSSTELNKQISESQAETTSQSKRADTAEMQLKVEADSAEMLRRLFYDTYRNLYREQKKDPEYTAINVLDYTTSRIKSVARRRSPQAEARIRYQFANLYNTLDNYKSAQQQAGLSSESRKNILGEDHPDTLKSLKRLAYALHQQGNYESAINTYNEALSGTLKQYGKNDVEVLQVLERLVYPLEGIKKFDELVVARQEIIRIKKLKSSRRKDYLNYTMLHLGRALRETGRYEEAETVFRELLDSCLDLAGPDDKNTFEAKIHLAWVLRLQDKMEEAEQLHDEVISLGNFMAKIHKPLADESYGRYLCYLGEYKIAETYLLHNIKPKSNELFTREGVDLNPGIDALIELYEAWGKPDEAEQMRKQLVTPDLNSG